MRPCERWHQSRTGEAPTERCSEPPSHYLDAPAYVVIRGLLDWLLHIDAARRLVVVATWEGSGIDASSEMVAVARATAQKVALLVRSDLKGEGLGTTLLGRLIVQCRQRGISRLVAEVMHGNTRMLRLATQHGFRCEAVEHGTCHLALELPVPAL